MMKKGQQNRNRNRNRNRNKNRHQDHTPPKPKKRNKVSDHFSRKDFVCKCGECKELLKLSLGLVGGLELLRNKCENRITILKGYECVESAEKKGKVRRNFHTQGVAADITVQEMSIEDLFLLVESIEDFKGIGLNVTENYVHVDVRKEKAPLKWVEENDDVIELTEENRSHYFSVNAPST